MTACDIPKELAAETPQPLPPAPEPAPAAAEPEPAPAAGADRRGGAGAAAARANRRAGHRRPTAAGGESRQPASGLGIEATRRWRRDRIHR